MKAKEYFEKYDDAIWQEAHDPEIHRDGPMAKMCIEFVGEVKDIIKARNVKTDQGLFGIINELNEKWNAVCNLFIKKYGQSPIRRDGFKIALKKEIGTISEG